MCSQKELRDPAPLQGPSSQDYSSNRPHLENPNASIKVSERGRWGLAVCQNRLLPQLRAQTLLSLGPSIYVSFFREMGFPEGCCG